MTCHITDYQRLYRDHAGSNSARDLRMVRLARELIEHHRQHCPECRGMGQRTNFNIVEPRQTRFYRPKEGVQG